MKNKTRIIDIIIFVAFLAVFLTFFARLVYCQTIYAEMTERGYNSDILAYMQEMQGIDSGYSFPYPVFFAIGRFFNLFLPIDRAITVAEVLPHLPGLTFLHNPAGERMGLQFGILIAAMVIYAVVTLLAC